MNPILLKALEESNLATYEIRRLVNRKGEVQWCITLHVYEHREDTGLVSGSAIHKYVWGTTLEEAEFKMIQKLTERK